MQCFSVDMGLEALQDASPVENLVLVSHGLLMRIFCMVYFHWTVEDAGGFLGTQLLVDASDNIA